MSATQDIGPSIVMYNKSCLINGEGKQRMPCYSGVGGIGIVIFLSSLFSLSLS